MQATDASGTQAKEPTPGSWVATRWQRLGSPFGTPAWVWSVVALVLGITLSYWIATQQQRRSEAEHQRALAHIANSGYIALVDQVHACELLVRAVQTLFLTSDNVDDAHFANAYANLKPREAFPSLQAIVYARRHTRADGDHFISEMAAPLQGNERVIGLDVNRQPPNLAAVLRSRDNDEPALSGPFRLVQARPQDKVDGITLRLPVYSPGSPPRNVAERRARMRGSLAVSFRISSLIDTALPEEARTRLHVQVSDITGSTALPLYDSHPAQHDDTAKQDAGYNFDQQMSRGGRVWRVTMHPVGKNAAGLAWQQPVFLPGLIASLLLALLVWSVANTRRRALALGGQMSRRYRESEERFRSLNELMPALVLLAHASDGRIDYANQAARERLGSEVGTGTALETLFDDPDIHALLMDLDGDAQWRNVEAMMRTLNGDSFWASTSISPVEVEGEKKLLMVAKDISEQRQLTELLSYQATHDALTELYNRREFERHVERALHAAAKGDPPSALLYIDLDQFKLINDTSGHLAGDQLLSQLALAMADELRAGDILARLGGDEFGVLAINARMEGAQILAERLRQRIEAYIYVWEQRSYTVSASIGVVLIDHPGQTLRDVLSHADAACYMAKDHGRNRIHFYSGQDDETIRRRGEMEWAHRLRWVIEENNLLLDYQEVIPLQPGSTALDAGPHLELLLRLRDEDGRVVLPGAFLPAAERYGMLPALDRWVIAQAISHFDALHVSGRTPGRCAVNLSASSLEDDTLADYILELIETHGVMPSRLCFEITETEAVRNLPRAVRFIERLRAAGCLVALDDFGAGMSSFGYLKNLPVDLIKIDGSFVRDIETDPMSHSIVGAITTIGHQLKHDIVAEWVDSMEKMDILRALGVDYAQGFAMHRPERVLYQRGEARHKHQAPIPQALDGPDDETQSPGAKV
ncbi:MAG: EAL domain-containing protein [Pseudomonadota bacterium]|nr:EAL domain-containing protein [Pseudomonadota bacterium]